jgi:2-polyprenyl-3-methyl-5-hydroxy-6-metoxy-1,4-benzoquinol methylase
VTDSPPNLFVVESSAASSTDFDISDPELLQMLEESQQTHFWFRARNRQILAFLAREGIAPPARILEIGCGTGTVLSAIAGAGFAAVGLEMHRELARRAAFAVPLASVFSANVFAPPPELSALGPFDAIAFFDVLEHLSTPGDVLRGGARLLHPGGRLIGTLPALRTLWSDYDAFAGHRLRYDRRSLAELFQQAHLPAPRAEYFFQALVPAMIVRRALVGRGHNVGDETRRRAQHRALDAPGRVANRILAGACGAERVLRRVLPLSAVPGASIWFSCRIDNPEAVSTASRPG